MPIVRLYRNVSELASYIENKAIIVTMTRKRLCQIHILITLNSKASQNGFISNNTRKCRFVCRHSALVKHKLRCPVTVKEQTTP